MKAATGPRVARKILGRRARGFSLVAQGLEGLRGAMGRERLFAGGGRRRRGQKHGDLLFMNVGKFAGAGQRLFAARDIFRPLPGGLGDLSLKGAARERRRQAAGLFDFLEQGVSFLDQGVGQGLETAGAGGRIRDLAEIRLLQQHELGIAGEAAGESVGQAKRLGERQDGDRIGAAQAGGKDRDGGAQQIHPGVAPGHHPPGRLAMDADRPGFEAAGALDPGPQAAQGAEFGDGQKFVGVGGEAEIDFFPRRVEIDPASFQRPQSGKAAAKRKGQFLGRRASGGVDDAARRRRSGFWQNLSRRGFFACSASLDPSLRQSSAAPRAAAVPIGSRPKEMSSFCAS